MARSMEQCRQPEVCGVSQHVRGSAQSAQCKAQAAKKGGVGKSKVSAAPPVKETRGKTAKKQIELDDFCYPVTREEDGSYSTVVDIDPDEAHVDWFNDESWAKCEEIDQNNRPEGTPPYNGFPQYKVSGKWEAVRTVLLDLTYEDHDPGDIERLKRMPEPK